MNLLTIKNLKKIYTDKVLLDNVDFGLEESEKVGVIGINGTGKSTFLKIIAGIEDYDGGDYTKGSNIVINYLPQNPSFEDNITILDYVLHTNRHAHENFGVEGDAKSILNRLGFEDYSTYVNQLSGGQKKKVALAGALLSEAEILILDEPTNHLDHEMIEWLEQWLRAYKGALIMVTHDRYFLDLVCNRIVELDKGKLYSYRENYEGFLKLKAEREAMAFSTQAKHQNILRKEIAWIQRGARARSTKQKAHIQRYEALRDEALIEIDGTVQLDALSSRLGKKTIELSNVTKSLGGKLLIKNFTYTFLRTDRVGILGANGTGKTTLMRMIMGELLPDNGTVEIGDTVNIGYYAQEAVSMDPEQKVIDYIKDTAEIIKTEDGYITAAQMLEKFLFNGTLQHQKIGKLSGGEKRRLYLAKVLMGAPNVLILDEPTNDLDISTLCILEDFLDTFPGILITVSHDRYFLDRTVNRMLTFEPGGEVLLFNGTYSDYYNAKRSDIDESDSFNQTSETGNGAESYRQQKAQNRKLKFTYAEQREYETIEADIEALECAVKSLAAEINNPKIASDFVKLNDLIKQKEAKESELDAKMERFIYLEDLAEKINSESKM